MIAKSLIAAAAVAGSALAFQAPEASAKTNFDIHLGFGVPAPYIEVPVYPAPRHVYSYDYGYDYGYEDDGVEYRVRRRYVEQDDDYGMSCKRGKRVLRARGFHDVQAYDCSAPTYGYSAWRHGEMFKVRVNTSGDIVSIREIH